MRYDSEKSEKPAVAKPEKEKELDLSTYRQEDFNLLSPVLKADTAAPFLRSRAIEVRLDPNPDKGDCYPAPGTRWKKDPKTNESTALTVAPAKPGLLKIASAAGLVIDTSGSGGISPDACRRCIEMAEASKTAARCGDCSCRYDVAYQYIGAVRTDLGWQIFKSTYEWSLDSQTRKIKRDGKKKAEQAKGPFDLEAYVDNRLDQIISERHGLAESKALLRLVRAICHVRQTYSREEMAKPFVVVRTELSPNLADPQVQAAISQRALASGSAIFGPEQERPAGEVVVNGQVIEGQVIESLATDPDFEDAETKATEVSPPDNAEPKPGDPFAGELENPDPITKETESLIVNAIKLFELAEAAIEERPHPEKGTEGEAVEWVNRYRKHWLTLPKEMRDEAQAKLAKKAAKK